MSADTKKLFMAFCMDCDRKETEYAAKAAELHKKYDSTCKQMGIEGKKIKSELAALLSDLPDIFSKIAKSTGSLQEAVTFYGNFVNFIMKRISTTN
ncbi:hypothetical protein KUTeg_015285 [Tegillarca granosa]|uniref:Uncharacterized protein n=1 Tax=Tegillarca granosa TaxID=220873 RepID=A0ABQ9ES47_TEGGR|nr:hypothetical protein KUTeg_015285 [Tegillarca granosa]